MKNWFTDGLEFQPKQHKTTKRWFEIVQIWKMKQK